MACFTTGYVGAQVQHHYKPGRVNHYPQEQGQYNPNQGNPQDGRYQNGRYQQNYRGSNYRGYDSYIEPGYRGFVSSGYTAGVGDYSLNRFEVSTTHGYQINPFVFVGGGIGLDYFDSDNYSGHHYDEDYYYDWDDDEGLYGVKFYVAMRFNFLPGPITPFFDIKAGGMAGDIFGPTVETSLGVSIWHLDLSVGFHYLRYNYSNGNEDDYNPYWEKDYYHSGYDDVNMNGISFKIGVNF